MATTIEEKLIYLETATRNAKYLAELNKANIEYNIMMGSLEDPAEDEEEA